MPFFLIALAGAVGWIAFGEGMGNLSQAGSLLYSEVFSGSNPYYKWLGAMIIIGAVGYIPEMEPIAMAFLVLVIVGIVLDHQSGFTGLIKGL